MLGDVLRVLLRTWRMRRDPIAYARSIGVRVGERCRLLGLTAETFGSEPYLIRIGDHVTVTAGVRFVTHDGGVWIFRESEPDVDVVAPIVIGNNVFIGVNSTLLPGTRIGDDCVIGAGSVVKGEIEAGSIAAGVPARRIRSKEEYWASVEPHVDRIRSQPEAARRAVWEARYADDLGPSRDD